MTGDEMKEVRERLRMTRPQFGHMLGYEGNRNTCDMTIRRYENGEKSIPLYLARYLWLLTMTAFRQEIPTHDTGWPIWPEWLKQREGHDVD